jgi:integrase
VADGKDPVKERELRKGKMTFAELAGKFVIEHAEAKLKPRTVKTYRDQLERIVLPKLGKLNVDTIDRADVARLHNSLKDTPYQANRVLALLSKIFSWAEKHGLRPDHSNPCRHIDKYPEKARERFLSAGEASKLADTLTEMEKDGKVGVYAAAAIRLLMLTGARVGEILSLQWDYVDIEQNALTLPDSKTGKRVIWLSVPARQVLSELPRIEGNPYVIVGDKEGQALVNLKDPWRAVRKKADLEDVRMHDLRHSFASFAAAGGLSLPLIGKLLGHTQAPTTQRYAHLADDPVKAAGEAVANRIAAAMNGEQGEVVPFKKK